ncbi:MAG TPA: oligosaccharide flippase family protein [Candidatus Dormibacteraeota bacterium]|nr:oligosaccharide flippase family protein [Candidatus Dormibacteraeota bacterium]
MRAPSLTRSSALNFADGAVTLAGALVVSIILARRLGSDGFGVYAMTMSVVMFTLLFARLGISATVRRYVAELDGKSDLATAGIILGRALRLGLLSGILATAALALISPPLATFFHRPELRVDLLIGAAMLLPMVAVGILRAVITGLQRYGNLVRLNLVTSPVWVAGCSIALWRGAGVPGVLVVSLGIEIINLAALTAWSMRYVGIRWRASLPADLRSRVQRYNLALGVLILLNAVVWERSEILFLGRFQGAAQVSFYAIPFALTERVVDLLPGAILGVLLPGLSYARGAADSGRFTAVLSDALRNLAMLTLPICLFGIPLAPVVIKLLYGSQFDGAVIVLQILLVSVVFGVLGQASRSALLGLERQGWLLKTGSIAAVVSIGLDLVLIPRGGAVGAAIANTIVQAAWALSIFAPLWSRVASATKRAVLKAALVAIALAGLLGLVMSVGLTATIAVGAGLLVLAAYAFTLVRLRLVPFRPEVAST